MGDSKKTIQEIKDVLKVFRDKRDWQQFHDPKNLAEAIAIEVGELQELFLWKGKKDIVEKIKTDSRYKERVGEELADILIFCLHFANSTNFDVTTIIEDKMKKAEDKYPVEKAKGKSEKYNEL